MGERPQTKKINVTLLQEQVTVMNAVPNEWIYFGIFFGRGLGNPEHL